MLHTFERTISAELRERALSLAELCEKPRNLSVVSRSPPEIEEHAFDLNFILFSEKARNFMVIVVFRPELPLQHCVSSPTPYP